MSSSRSTLLRKLALSGVAVLLALVVMELGARVVLTQLASRAAFQRFASLTQLQQRAEAAEGSGPARLYAPHRYLGYYPSPGFRRGPNRHNERGFRGDEVVLPKPAGEFRIVCLGGSTTYGSSVLDFRESYPYRLEQELRSRGLEHVTVVNGGAAGWSSFETLVSFQMRVLDLEPDLVVVYHGVNDVHARMVWPPSAYRGDNSGRRIAGASRPFMPSLAEHSTFLRYLLVRGGAIEPHSSLNRTLDPAPPTWYGKEFEKQRREGTYPQGVFRETSASSMLQANPPRYFRRNLENLIAVARLRRIPVALATFVVSPDFENEPWASSPEYLSAYTESNDIVSRLAAASGSTLIDLARVFPRERRLFHDGRHMTAEGNRIMAQLVAQGLLGDLPPPAP